MERYRGTDEKFESFTIEEKVKMFDDIVKFLSETPYPTDKVVHSWVEENDLNAHAVEEIFYAFATNFVLFWTGGKANEKGVTEADVDSEELQKGIEVEMEHVGNKVIAKRIALDHLAEMDDYYTRLKKMESGSEA